MPKEEENFFRIRQADNVIDIYEGREVIIITANGIGVKDYKQGDYRRVSGDEHGEDDIMNERLGTTRLEMQELVVKHNKPFECFSYELSLSSDNYFKDKAKLSKLSYIEHELERKNDSKKLYELYKAEKLYYQDSLKRTFSSLDTNARKKVIANAEKEAKKEHKKNPLFGYDNSDAAFEMSKETYVASYLYNNWLPDLKILVISSSSLDKFLNSFPYQLVPNPEVPKKTTYYIRDLVWKTKNDYIKTVEGSLGVEEVYRYNLPNLYTLKRTYYIEVQKNYNIIATQGCLITCYADIITFHYHKNNYRKAQNPHDVKDRMQAMDSEFLAGEKGAKPGFGKGPGKELNMMRDNVAEDYGLDHRPTDEVIDEDKKVDHVATSEMFRKEIEDRINKDLPTIARLSLGDATHYVVVVGLKYDENDRPIEYIINDPGRKDYIIGADGKPTDELKKYRINCESRVYEYSKKKMDRIYSLDQK